MERRRALLRALVGTVVCLKSGGGVHIYAVMSQRIQFAIVIVIGAGLLAWEAVNLRYTAPAALADGTLIRDDGWTGTRQFLKCEDKPTGRPVLTIAFPSSTAPAAADAERASRLPVPPGELDRINQLRQKRHLLKVDQWGRELVRVCRWVNY
ncbi:MAG TPA: hypothetical protein VFW01_03485 [bacterium]|nr:hypothetical protein [bacterium]